MAAMHDDTAIRATGTQKARRIAGVKFVALPLEPPAAPQPASPRGLAGLLSFLFRAIGRLEAARP